MIKNFLKFTVVMIAVLITAANITAQSTNPDAPTRLTNGVIEGINRTAQGEKKTYYYSFDVTKGNLNLVVDLVPPNSQSDGGGVLDWTLMSAKFEKLKWDIKSAQGSPERVVKDYPVTVKRKLIIKVVVGGNLDYKLKFSGSATSFK